MRPIISGSTGPIFTYFSPNGRYFIVDTVIDPDLFYRFLKGRLPWQPILGEIGKMSFIRQADVRKRIEIWQFRFKTIQWRYFAYILCTFDEDQSSNPRDYKGNNCNWWEGKNRHIPPNISATAGPIFINFSGLVWHMNFDYKTDISFAAA